MTFPVVYTSLIAALLVLEPLVSHADWSSFGTWFWFGLGIIGLGGLVLARKSPRRL